MGKFVTFSTGLHKNRPSLNNLNSVQLWVEHKEKEEKRTFN